MYSLGSARIFLSAVSAEFESYRATLRHDLTRHNVEVKVQEDFKDHGSVMLDQLDLYIKSCDAVVQFIGDMTGSFPTPGSVRVLRSKYPNILEKLPALRTALDDSIAISYTQWEAWLALYHDKPLLIATAHPTAPRGPNYTPTDASIAAQKEHVERLRTTERYPACAFTSADNLAKHIAYTTILDVLASHREETRILAEQPPLVYELYSSTIRYSPARQIYDFFTERLVRNVGTDAITCDQQHIWCNHFPDNPRVSEKYYAAHPLIWDAIDFVAWDASGPLDVVVVNSLGSRIDQSIQFAHGRQKRYLYPGDTKRYFYKYHISPDLFGPYYERYVTFPINELRLRVCFPRERNPTVWGYIKSHVGPAVPIMAAITPLDPLDSSDRAFDWRSRRVLQGYTDGIAWDLDELNVKL